MCIFMKKRSIIIVSILSGKSKTVKMVARGKSGVSQRRPRTLVCVVSKAYQSFWGMHTGKVIIILGAINELTFVELSPKARY